MNFLTSKFYCTQCGQEGFDILRNSGQQREPGHLKKLYCINCKKETNHAEVREIGGYTKEDFDMEFELGRFSEDGTKQKIGDLFICSCNDCPFNVNGRCWNSNNSAECGHKPV